MVKLYSIEEAAKMLGGVSPLTVMKWYANGRLNRTKVGRRTMIAETELQRFIEESNRPAQLTASDKA